MTNKQPVLTWTRAYAAALFSNAGLALAPPRPVVSSARVQAVFATRALLESLAAGELAGEDHAILELYARRLLAGYPDEADLELVAIALPCTWGPRKG